MPMARWATPNSRHCPKLLGLSHKELVYIYIYFIYKIFIIYIYFYAPMTIYIQSCKKILLALPPFPFWNEGNCGEITAGPKLPYISLVYQSIGSHVKSPAKTFPSRFRSLQPSSNSTPMRMAWSLERSWRPCWRGKPFGGLDVFLKTTLFWREVFRWIVVRFIDGYLKFVVAF